MLAVLLLVAALDSNLRTSAKGSPAGADGQDAEGTSLRETVQAEGKKAEESMRAALMQGAQDFDSQMKDEENAMVDVGKSSEEEMKQSADLINENAKSISDKLQAVTDLDMDQHHAQTTKQDHIVSLAQELSQELPTQRKVVGNAMLHMQGYSSAYEPHILEATTQAEQKKDAAIADAESEGAAYKAELHQEMLRSVADVRKTMESNAAEEKSDLAGAVKEADGQRSNAERAMEERMGRLAHTITEGETEYKAQKKRADSATFNLAQLEKDQHVGFEEKAADLQAKMDSFKEQNAKTRQLEVQKAHNAMKQAELDAIAEEQQKVQAANADLHKIVKDFRAERSAEEKAHSADLAKMDDAESHMQAQVGHKGEAGGLEGRAQELEHLSFKLSDSLGKQLDEQLAAKERMKQATKDQVKAIQDHMAQAKESDKEALRLAMQHEADTHRTELEAAKTHAQAEVGKLQAKVTAHTTAGLVELANEAKQADDVLEQAKQTAKGLRDDKLALRQRLPEQRALLQQTFDATQGQIDSAVKEILEGRDEVVKAMDKNQAELSRRAEEQRQGSAERVRQSLADRVDKAGAQGAKVLQQLQELSRGASERFEAHAERQAQLEALTTAQREAAAQAQRTSEQAAAALKDQLHEAVELLAKRDAGEDRAQISLQAELRDLLREQQRDVSGQTAQQLQQAFEAENKRLSSFERSAGDTHKQHLSDMQRHEDLLQQRMKALGGMVADEGAQLAKATQLADQQNKEVQAQVQALGAGERRVAERAAAATQATHAVVTQRAQDLSLKVERLAKELARGDQADVQALSARLQKEVEGAVAAQDAAKRQVQAQIASGQDRLGGGIQQVQDSLTAAEKGFAAFGSAQQAAGAHLEDRLNTLQLGLASGHDRQSQRAETRHRHAKQYLHGQFETMQNLQQAFNDAQANEAARLAGGEQAFGADLAVATKRAQQQSKALQERSGHVQADAAALTNAAASRDLRVGEELHSQQVALDKEVEAAQASSAGFRNALLEGQKAREDAKQSLQNKLDQAKRTLSQQMQRTGAAVTAMKEESDSVVSRASAEGRLLDEQLWQQSQDQAQHERDASDDVQKRLAKLEQSDDSLKEWGDRYETQAQEWRKATDKGFAKLQKPVQGKKSLGAIEAENQQLRQMNQELQSENAHLSAEDQGLGEEVEQLQAKLEAKKPKLGAWSKVTQLAERLEGHA